MQGVESAEEDTAGFAFGLAGDIQTIVIAVDKVDVGEAGRSEEDCVARSFSGCGVGGGVVFSKIGFDFNDTGGEKRWVVAD